MFSSFELDLFEKEILANPKATEHDASRFFERFPKFLLLGAGIEIRREVVLFASNGQTIGRVDFFRRSYGRRFWDLIELKGPQVPVIVKTGQNHPKLSDEVEGALTQVQDYKEIVETNQNVRDELLVRGIPVCRPEMLIIAGRDNAEVPEELIHKLFDRVRSRGIQLFTFSDLLRFGKEHHRSNKLIIVPAFFMSATVLRYRRASPGAQHLVEVWLKGRLIHKVNEMDREFRPLDPRSNRYYLEGFSSMVQQLEEGLQMLTLKTREQLTDGEERLIAKAAALHANMQGRLHEIWVKDLAGASFLPNMRRITIETLKEVLNASNSSD